MSKACLAYEEEYGKIPKTAKTLIAFAKRTKGLKEPSLEDANKAIEKAQARAAKKEQAAKDANASKKGGKKGKKADSPDAGEKGGKKGKKKNKDAGGADDAKEAKEAAAPPAEEKKEQKEQPSSKFKVGDGVLLSKDRVGIVRYVGEIPELGDGIWYGVELTDGSIGQTDGAVKGKRYFQTEAKRALFVPLSKIRRRTNQKDHRRTQSMKELIEANQRLRSQSQTSSTQEDSKQQPSAEPPAAVPEEAEPAEDEEAAADEPAAAEPEEEPETAEEPESKDDDEPEEQYEAAPVGDVDVKDIKQAAGGNLLKFILAQSDGVQQKFFRVYCSPQKHQVLCSAYDQVRELDYEQQLEAWAQILGRLA